MKHFDKMYLRKRATGLNSVKRFALSFLLLVFSIFTLKGQEPKLILPIADLGAVNSINFSVDGKRILTPANDATAKIWDTETGVLLTDLKGHTNAIIKASYSPDGNKIVTVSSDGTSKIWNAKNGSWIADVKNSRHNIVTAVFSADGNRIFTTHDDFTAKTWNAQTGDLQFDLHARINWLDSAFMGTVDRMFCILTKDGIIKKWYLHDIRLPADLNEGGRWSRIYLSKSSPDGKRTIKFSSDTVVQILDAVSGAVLANLKGHKNSVNSVSFSADGQQIVTASDDSTAKVWDVQSCRLKASVKEKADGIIAALFVDSCKEVLTVTGKGNVKIWNAKNGAIVADLGEVEGGGARYSNNPVFSPSGALVFIPTDFEPGKIMDTRNNFVTAQLKGNTEHIITAAFCADDSKLYTLSENGALKMWDARTGVQLFELKGTFWPNSSEVTFSQDSKKILTISANTPKVWDAENGTLLAVFKSYNKDIGSAVFSPDGTKVLTAANDKTAKVFDAQTGKLLTVLEDNNDGIYSASFFPDGNKVLTMSANSKLKIWDGQKGMILKDLKTQSKVIQPFAISFDGRRIAAQTADSTNTDFVTFAVEHTIQVWDVYSGVLLTDIKGHSSSFRSAEISPDGNRTVTRVDNGSPILWDSKSGALIARLNNNNNNITTRLFFFADGKRILTLLSDNTAKIWDEQSRKLIAEIGHHENGFNNTSRFAISPDEKKLVMYSSKLLTMWDTQSGKFLRTLEGIHYYPSSLTFTPDGKKIIAIFESASHGFSQTWDAASGELLTGFDGYKDDFNQVQISMNGKKLLTVLSDDTAKVWDIASGKVQSILTGNKCGFRSAVFSPHGSKILTSSTASIAKLWDATNGALLANLKIDSNAYKLSVKFSPDDQKVLTGSEDWNPFVVSTDPSKSFNLEKASTVVIWDTNNGARLGSLDGFKYLPSAEFSPDSKKIVGISNDFSAKTWDAKTGKLLADEKDYIKGINSVKFYPDSKFVISGALDGTAKVWDSQSGKLVYTFFAVDSTDYFAQLPTGYYMATPNAAKLLHYVTKNLEVISFEQLDIKYNRPDKVLEAIGCPDTALIRSYKRAYEKRIKRLGIDTTTFKSGYSVPKSDFFNRDEIEQQEPKKDRLSLHITGFDSTYNLDRFNVWVNKVPVYGIRGISLKKQNIHTLDKTVAITLSQGINRIEASVTDANGTESYHSPLYVKYTPDKPMDTLLHFIGIGIDHFLDKKYNLNWSVKDIHDLAVKFKEKYGDKCRIDTLFNEDVKLKKVSAFKKKLLKTGVNNKIIIAYSGHGLLSSDYDYYLSSYDINFNKPDENGIPYDALETLLDSIPARKKLMLIDACNSGEVDKDELARYTFAEAGLDSAGVHKGVKMLIDPNHKMGMKNSFELMKELFVNVGKSTGATIISAAGGTQFALEKGDLKNGVFTYSILEYLKQPHCTISALKQHVNSRVTELTKGMQVPTTRAENSLVDWEVW